VWHEKGQGALAIEARECAATVRALKNTPLFELSELPTHCRHSVAGRASTVKEATIKAFYYPDLGLLDFPCILVR
jgi:hypothetical protein